MDKRFLTVLGVSLVFALVVSSVFYQMTSHASSGGKRSDERPMKDMVVATRPLNIGIMLKPADVKIVKVAPEAFPKGAYSKVEDVLERSIVSNILLEEPLIEGRLSAKGSGFGLAATIPVGMRAVAVRVNDVAGVAGFALPGMHVDVLVTGHPEGAGTSITKTTLQNVQVLSAGTTLQSDARGQAINTPTVTLLVTPEQAELLTLANLEGHIVLVLRNSNDAKVEPTPGGTLNEIYGRGREIAAVPPAPKRESPPPTPRPRPQTPQSTPTAPVQATPVAPPPTAAPAVLAPNTDAIVVYRGTQRSVETVPKKQD